MAAKLGGSLEETQLAGDAVAAQAGKVAARPARYGSLQTVCEGEFQQAAFLSGNTGLKSRVWLWRFGKQGPDPVPGGESRDLMRCEDGTLTW